MLWYTHMHKAFVWIDTVCSLVFTVTSNDHQVLKSAITKSISLRTEDPPCDTETTLYWDSLLHAPAIKKLLICH